MIPNIAHYNYGLAEQKEDFLFVYYIAVLSCKLINNPDKIYFYYHYEPKGHWWEKTKELCEPVLVSIPTHIGAKELKQIAHKSDVLRIMKLKELGGVYLDIDTICVRSYKDLLYNKFVIANEITESGKNMGLCNAIMMSEPNSSFINDWIGNYETFFNPDGWQEASTILPWELAKQNKNITILKPDTFLLPSWEKTDLIFEKPNNISEDLIVLHYWNQYSHKKYLKQITNFDWVIENSDTLYGKLLLNVFNLACTKKDFNVKKEKTLEKTFTEIYEKNIWGNNNCEEYNGSSGSGSSIDFNKSSYIPFLQNFIKDNKIKSVVDLGCGDFRCGELLYGDLDINYTGYDTYKKVIEHNKNKFNLEKYNFIHCDFFTNKEVIINADLCILKDVIQHWSLDNINIFLDYLVSQKKFKYILICNCSYQTKDNTDIANGDFRPLSSNYFPLKKYNPVKIFNYNNKEVSIIISL